jgi:hypothetical protein
MERPVLRRAVEKLAQAGEQAGLSVEEMIRILNAGVSVESLVALVEGRLEGENPRMPR